MLDLTSDPVHVPVLTAATVGLSFVKNGTTNTSGLVVAARVVSFYHTAMFYPALSTLAEALLVFMDFPGLVLRRVQLYSCRSPCVTQRS
jgi:hypothetical protein